MDYRLDALSTRTFEHLVQSLAFEAITNELTPFGDGPDGGREATFEGPTGYQAGNSAWQGYGVIQAKFRQRLGANDGAWAERELAKELAAFSTRKRKRRIPEYYIFATNVALSAIEGSGSKDKILNRLKNFADANGIKAYDVWDYDKLRLLLDNNQSVRTAYSAWITPGDVLYELAKHLQRHRHDYYKIVVNYLQKEVLTDQYARLEQAGHSADESIPLSQVFVDLPVTGQPVQSFENTSTQSDRKKLTFFTSGVVEAARQRYVPDPSTSIMGLNGSTHDQQGRFVLIGGPGQGKTTLGQFICQIFRTALLINVDQGLVDPAVRQAMDGVINQWDAGRLPRPMARRLPLRIVLSEFAKRLADGEVSSVLDHLAQKISARSIRSLTPDDVKELMLAYPSILVLDGLDEVPPSTNRDQLLDCIRDFRIDITTEQIDVVIVATSRPQGYNADFSPQQYRHLYLEPLPPPVALDYARRLSEIRFGQDASRFEKVISRLERAMRSPSTARLMRSPLQVTIMTLLVDRMGQPPQERWTLFSDYYNLIYQREIEREIPAATVLRDHRSDIDTIHARVGLVLQIESERSGGTDSRLTTQQFSEIVDGYLAEEGHEGEELQQLREDIIEAAANRLVFLVGLESGQVGFEIRSLQEFMAAEGLMGDDAETQSRLRLIAPVSNWRNVFLFAAGKAFSERKHLRDTIGQICSELNDDPVNELNIAVKAGSQLALDLLEDGPAARQPAMSRSLTRLALQLLDTESRDILNRLISVYQRQTAHIFREELSVRLRQGGRSARKAAVIIARLADLTGSDLEGLLEQARPLLLSPEPADLRRRISLSDGRPGVLRDSVVDVLSQVAPASAIPAIDKRYVGHLSVWSPEETIPAELAAVRNYSDFQDALQKLAIRIKTDEGHMLGVMQIISVDQPREVILRPIKLPSGHSDWDFLNAVVDFLKLPTARTLTTALELGSKASDSLLNAEFLSIAPWPLAVALDAARSDSWETVIAGARRGEWGDPPRWRAREDELSSGLALSELEPNLDVVRVGTFNIERDRARAKDYVRFIQQRPELCACPSVVDSLYGILTDPHQDEPVSSPDADVVVKLQLGGPHPYMGFFSLETIEPFDPDSPEWDSLFRNISAGTSVFVGPRAAESILKILKSCWIRNPGDDLYAAFSLCVPAPEAAPTEFPEVPERLLQGAADSDLITAAIVLDLRRNRDVARVSHLIDRLPELGDGLDYRLLSALRVQVRNLARYEENLLALKKIADLRRTLFPDIDEELRRLSAARRSDLLAESTWHNLGFPMHLRWCIISRIDENGQAA
ncbi:NACHT domain-containing protein [Micromonospora chersina]|uniref:NACHT domain-containing protein n=1 Tax=Micromonospora chersina TaxID=47854 RepID=UPI0033DFFD08